MLPFVSTIIKQRLSVTTGNHEAMHTSKQYFPTNDHAAILSLLTRLILILIQSHHTRHRYIFNIAKLYLFFLMSYLNSVVFSALHNENLGTEI